MAERYDERGILPRSFAPASGNLDAVHLVFSGVAVG